MADIRINSLSTTASASSSDDFLALDGATNGTRKLNAYSPTFGGNLTVSGTGLSSVAGALNVTGSLLAHQTAALNIAHEGSSLSQLVSYGADASTYGRLNLTLRKAGTGVGSVTALAMTSTDATFAGNLIVSGGTHTFGTANGGTYITTPGTAASTGTLFIQGGNASGSTAGGGVVLYGGSHASAPGWVRVGLAGTSKFAVNTSGLGSGTDVFTVDQAGNLTVSGTGNSTVAGKFLIGGGSDTGQTLQVAGSAYIGSATTSTNLLTVQGNGPNTTHQAGTSAAALWNRWLNSAGTRRGYYGYTSAGDSTFTIMNEENGSFVLGTNNATALTLDSSQNATFAGRATVSATTASTSTTTGALVVSGGVGVAGALYMGGTLYQGLGTSGNVVSGEGLMSASSTRSMVQLDTYHASSGGFMMMRRARGSFASPTAVQSGDLIGRLIGRGYGATAFFAQNCAQISMTAAENFSDVTAGSYISFETSATGQSSTSAPVEALRISAATSSTVAGATIVYGDFQLAKTVTATGTTGAQTINKSSGRVNFAASATSLVVTNSLCTTDSIITISKATNNSTARLGAVVAAAGSFTIYMDVAPDAECAVNFHLTN